MSRLTISNLPNECLELVLSQLPLPELVLSHSLVCRRWLDIIQSQTFIPHRKGYYQYKLGLDTTRDKLNRLVMEQVKVVVDLQGWTTIQQIHHIGTSCKTSMLERCLPWLLSIFSSSDMAKSLHLTSEMFTNLHLHPRYSMCMSILEDRFPHMITSPLPILTLILCTARNLSDVSKTLQLLLFDGSPTTELHILEMVYLLSTYLLVFERQYNLPPRPQYLIFHALSLHYNSWLHDPTDNFTPQSGQQNCSVKLTAEQSQIVNMNLIGLLGTRDTIRIMAYAGTGKTTTLVELCRRNPKIGFLLVVFNKSVEVHSKRVFPPNVTIKTANALSFKFVTETEGRDRFQGFSLKYTDLIQYNYVPPRDKLYPGFSLYHRAAMIMDTMTTFYNSEEKHLGVEHTPDKWNTSRNILTEKPLNSKQRECLAEDAAEVWKSIRLKYNSRMRFDHSSSMKQFQLSSPDLQHWGGPHDLLLLDEAQDMNPCMLSVCLQQKCPKIVVGDQYQQIYSFRGAVNALDLVLKSERTFVKSTYVLTQSFRFGPEIAFIANSCLHGLMGSTGPDLVGSGKVDIVTGSTRGQGMGKTVILGRTNIRLFEEMVNLVCLPEHHTRPKIAFPNDPSGYGTDPMGWERLTELAHFKAGNIHLMTEKSQRNPMYKKVWAEFVGQVEAGKDLETMSKIAIVQKFGAKLVEYIEILMEQSQYGINDHRVEMVFSTVHKFKGLEMDTVRLLDDFAYCGVPYGKPTLGSLESDEWNLLYVALTRAKRMLVINDALFYLLTSNFINHSFEFVLPASTGHCVKCKSEVEGSRPVSLFQERVRVGDLARSEGWLCKHCVSSEVRMVNHTLGGKDRLDDWKVVPGMVEDSYHSWVKCLVGPGRGEIVDEGVLEQHEDRMRSMGEEEIEKWVEEVHLQYEEDLFMMADDDQDFLITVEEFENDWDEDDELLLNLVY